MKTIYNKYDKRLIASLPRVLFEGRIEVVQTAPEAERAVRGLLEEPILGVDTETRPSFKRGHQYSLSLLQVSTHDTCFLFRLNLIGMTPAIRKLLEDTRVPKIGLSWHDDLHGLQRLCPFKPGLFIDLQDHVKEIGIEDLSLQKLFANLFGQKVSKHERLTNWEAPVLKEQQKRYAATDAWACIKIYEELQRLKLTGDYELITIADNDEACISEKG